MDGTKSLLASKTFWGALLALLGVVGPAFGLSKLGTWAANPATLDACMQVGGVLGAILAMYGRATATKTIGKPDPKVVQALAFVAFLPMIGLGGCNSTGLNAGTPGQSSGGWFANAISGLNAGTVALINFNNALIQLNITVIGNVQAQAKALAPLFCGGISLGTTLATGQANVRDSVNAYLASHQGQGRILAVAGELCSVAGLPVNVTGVPASTAPAAASAPGG